MAKSLFDLAWDLEGVIIKFLAEHDVKMDVAPCMFNPNGPVDLVLKRKGQPDEYVMHFGGRTI